MCFLSYKTFLFYFKENKTVFNNNFLNKVSYASWPKMKISLIFSTFPLKYQISIGWGTDIEEGVRYFAHIWLSSGIKYHIEFWIFHSYMNILLHKYIWNFECDTKRNLSNFLFIISTCKIQSFFSSKLIFSFIKNLSTRK